ncbi:class I SAM-dependent methyltransferase [Alteribacter keqinensis]|uniref:Class I SAM-dependent methyltransferase n=1 Tax=Alteribacter keqinensis TaxID=2483800 RepID=A0A3M7TL40_9BACI|nr:class I SAM-dependent methyltransferase [Alteribacter keqinensis]RNA66279.1 class I SAM-dependent methyltransferase [Alteribacter keqinensis]
MGINFHDKRNKASYTTREADQTWKDTIERLVSPTGRKHAVDIGCGGGIYTKALADLGVPSVTGVDFSEAMLEGARDNCGDDPRIRFQKGSAENTGLSRGCSDLVLQRALIHHLSDLRPSFFEALRLLGESGVFVVQDRTPEDCLLPGSENHIRGYLFSLFPRLAEKEVRRRHRSEKVSLELRASGFRQVEELTLWETRHRYPAKKELYEDLRARNGRSILHELSDGEIEELICHIDKQLPDGEVIEKDRWTIWKARV